MHARVVARRFIAGLGASLQAKVDDFLRDAPLDEAKGKALAGWLHDNFRFDVSRTPRGGKAYKEALDALHWYLANGRPLESYRPNIEDKWGDLRRHLDEVVRLFTDEGGRSVPKELRLGGNTYVNEVGFDEAKLAEYAKGLEQVFDEVKGWRRKALAGGLTVVLASPKSFAGTAGGKYQSSADRMLVRATPNVLKRTRGSYGAFDYIIIHELGHRYEHKLRPKLDFDKSEWHSTAYSRKEGEAFAELFAMTNFGLPVPGKEDVLAKFEDYMATGKVPEAEFRELPEHLRKLLGR